MTRRLRRIDWAAPGANVGSAELFTLLLLSPLVWGAHYRLWLLGLGIGLILGLYFYLRRERYSEPGPDATRPGFRAEASSPLQDIPEPRWGDREFA